LCLGACLPERVGLGLSTPFRHRLREVGEQHCEPEPDRELERESDLVLRGREVPDEHQCRQHTPDQHDEHDRVPDHVPRMELDHGISDCPRGNRRVK
jgi:hypothetical protein